MTLLQILIVEDIKRVNPQRPTFTFWKKTIILIVDYDLKKGINSFMVLYPIKRIEVITFKTKVYKNSSKFRNDF